MILVLSLAGFIVLLGCALFFSKLLKTDSAEGMVPAVGLVILVMFLSALLGRAVWGLYVLITVGVSGIVWMLSAMAVSGRRRAGRTLPRGDVARTLPRGDARYTVFLMIAAFLYGAFFFYGSFLQHPEDLSTWGLAVKTMLMNGGKLVDFRQFLPSSVSVYGWSGLFILFFQLFSGYSEGGMYASAFLLLWIGSMLPFARCQKKDRNRVFLYSAILFASINSIYLYTYKSLCPELACGAWAGGIAGWWMCRERMRRVKNLIIASCALVILCSFLSYFGLVMAGLDILFFFYESFAIEKGRYNSAKFRKSFIFLNAASIVLLVFVTAFIVSNNLAGTDMSGTGLSGADLSSAALSSADLSSAALSSADLSSAALSSADLSSAALSSAQGTSAAVFETDDSKNIIAACVSAFIGRELSTETSLRLTALSTLVMLCIVLTISGWIANETGTVNVRMMYIIFASAAFLILLILFYARGHSLSEVSDGTAIQRYMGMYSLFTLVIVLTVWFRRRGIARPKIWFAGSLLLLLLFISGFNSKFLSNATMFRSDKITGESDIKEATSETVQLKTLLTDSDRVYFINQGTSNEFPQSVALYQLYGIVSDYRVSPWRFFEGGCNIGEEKSSSLKIDDLPAILTQGGYTYVWIYKDSKYIRSQLPQIMKIDEEVIAQGGLYRIIYIDGAASELEFIISLYE